MVLSLNRAGGVLMFTLFLSLSATGQNELIKARNLLDQGELIKAKGPADRAIRNEKTAKKAKTWYYRGKIHYKLFRSSDKEHQEFVKEKGGKVPMIAVRSYLKALELDDAGKYSKEIRKELPVLKSALLNYGVKAFNERDYKKAFNTFNLGVRTGETLNDGKPVDTLAYFNAGLAARQLGKDSIALEHFKTSIKLNNQEAKSYFIASRILKEQGKRKEAFRMVQKGREEHPEFRKLVLEELDYFIRLGKYKKARKKLEKAVEKNKRNPVLHFSLGTVYDRLYQNSGVDSVAIGDKDSSLFKEAKEHYKEAIRLDSSFHSAFYSLGALYYNRGADVLNASNTLKGQAKYEEEIAKAKKDLQKAKPFLERALEIEPQDQQTLISLRNLYSRLDKKKKAQKLQKRIDN